MRIHLKSISQLHELFGTSKAKHPLVTLIDFSKLASKGYKEAVTIVSSLYMITLKTYDCKAFRHGRSYIDFGEGSLYGVAPEQVIHLDPHLPTPHEGWALYFHPDLIRNSPLMETIASYAFFSYETNEALHLSEAEKKTLNELVYKIEEECAANLDEFSQEVIVANISLLLSYIKRFYNRQFITRKTMNSDLLVNFEKLLKGYFKQEDLYKQGLPKVSYFSKRLHLSAPYLSDLLKKETGKNIQEHIHYQLIDKAKQLLLSSSASVSEISFDLGFEYPQYFSRLFKKKTGMTPSQYRVGLN